MNPPLERAAGLPRLRRATRQALALALFGALVAARAAEDFSFFPQPLDIPERGEVLSYVLLLNTNRFSFMPPPQWQLKYEAADQKCSLAPPDLGASLAVKVVPAPASATNSLEPETLREELKKRFPEARIKQEFPCVVGDVQGLGFELERPAARGSLLTTRLAFVAFPGGVLEFSLTAMSAKVSEYSLGLRTLMTSFRIEPRNSPRDRR